MTNKDRLAREKNREVQRLAESKEGLMRNNSLLLREKRHTTAYMRCADRQRNSHIVSTLTLKALHHAQMAHLAHQARREYTARPRQAM